MPPIRARMLPYLIDLLLPWLERHRMGFLRVLGDAPFRAMLCIVLSFLFCLIFGPRFINWLTRQKIGDNPNFDEAAMNDIMANKKNTPTMGGVLIIASIVTSTLLLADLRNFYVLMALLCVLYLGALGAIDDWLKLTKHRRGNSKDRQGLSSKHKFLLQLVLGVLLGVFTYLHGKGTPAN